MVWNWTFKAGMQGDSLHSVCHIKWVKLEENPWNDLGSVFGLSSSSELLPRKYLLHHLHHISVWAKLGQKFETCYGGHFMLNWLW